MANKYHYVESLEANKATCSVVFPWEKTTRWNECDCPACLERRPTQNAADGAKRPRCPVCGTTDHTVDKDGFVIPNPPRR